MLQHRQKVLAKAPSTHDPKRTLPQFNIFLFKNLNMSKGLLAYELKDVFQRNNTVQLFQNNALGVSQTGYGLVGLGLLAIAVDVVVFPGHQGGVIGNGAIVVSGFGLVIVGRVLKKIEQRLDRLERGRS
jgi:hypothetical protein